MVFLAYSVLCLANQATSPAPLQQTSETPIPKLPDVPAARQLTRQQAIQIALKTNGLGKVAQFQVEAYAANLTGQRAPLNPVFNYGGLNNTVAPAPTLNLNEPSNYGFLFTFETNGANQWRTSEAKNQLNQARQDAQATVLNIRQAAESAYINLQIANQALAQEKASYDDIKRIRDLTQKQYEVGAVPQTNAVRAEIALAQETGNLLSQVTAVRAARAGLNLAMGMPPDEPVDASEQLTSAPQVINPDQLKRLALESRPELKSAEFSRSALHAAVGVQRSQYYPNLFVGTDLRQVKSGIFLFGISMPLFDFGSIHGAVKQAKKAEQAQEAQITIQRQQILQDVEAAIEALTVSKQTVDAFERGMLPQAEALEAKIEKGYVLGGNTILDLLDAQSTLRSARVAYYGAVGAYRLAQAQLERAVGVSIPSTTMTTASN